MFTSTCVWRSHVYNRAGPQPTSRSLIGENCFRLTAKRKQAITLRQRWMRADRGGRRGLVYVSLKPVTYNVSKQTWCRGTIPRGGWFVDWNVSGQSWHLYIMSYIFSFSATRIFIVPCTKCNIRYGTQICPIAQKLCILWCKTSSFKIIMIKMYNMQCRLWNKLNSGGINLILNQILIEMSFQFLQICHASKGNKQFKEDTASLPVALL